ncbi:hypothetical protein Pmar_PMAR024229 [Perkinsus marinus ATCC 50983]|uniref:Uncharacterized protein n=1 Tax=Perkinsus marinus (strain ATCC 50983 / TXsc) TaxID=423536 RepID=C5KW40_PERM5|nr:hypothetical protein Pmar_PMAR024229 [Perkinsus marinus ATCC 50983]EER11303.1 hypothetical protein Pmar_PMAR024229 [Perkinsus marinus ATCC 50983]|eukprot:XP_002779508.1 hypothetical protein Pmar_PMAR024229 [Perkinsus marinus ATCC 50983]
MELDLYFTTAPEGVVAYDKGAAEEIWVGLEVAEGPPPLAALIDFEISSKTFPDKLAWAVASHLFRGEAMRLTGIGPRSIIKMVTAIGIAAKWFDDHGRGVVLSRAGSVSVSLPPGMMYEGRKTDFSWATQISTRLQPTEEMRRIQEALATAEEGSDACLSQLDELARTLALDTPGRLREHSKDGML